MSTHPAPSDSAHADAGRWLPLVKHIAARVILGLPAHADVGDLIGDGVFGLLDALEKFDPARGVKFETYAYTRIRGAMLDGLRKVDPLSANTRRDYGRAEAVSDALAADLGRTPTEAEVAAALDMPLEEYRALLAYVARGLAMSLDTMWETAKANGDQFDMADVLIDRSAEDPAEAAERSEEAAQLRAAVGRLPPREAEVLHLLYWRQLAPKEAADIMHLSVSRISQLHTKAVLRLRGMYGSEATDRPKIAARALSEALSAGWARRRERLAAETRQAG